MTLTNKLLVIKIRSILKKAQRIQPTLYDGSVIAKGHAVISVIDDEETLILEEVSRSKMLDKQNDPISIEKKIKISPIDYSKLNKIKEDFGKCFVTQKELSAEQAFWLKHLSFSETPVTSYTPVRIEAPSELSKCFEDKNIFEIQIKQLRIDNDQLLNQIMSQEIMHIVANSVDILDVKKSCVNNCNKCLELEIELFKKKDFIEKEAYDKLVKSYSNLEKHCISLELATQLNQEIFQRENSGENLNAPTFNQLFEINELKAQSQEKDTVIRKLKERIKSLSGKDSVENVKKDIDEIETINIELEHSVAKLLSENENLRKEREHLKSIYKDQFDSIRKTRVQSKEHCDSLIAQINAKSVENSDLNAQLQEKVFAIAALKNELRKLKGKNVVDTAVSKPSATIAPGMFKLDIEPISHRLKNNRDAHEVYLEKTIENTDTLRGLELLVYVSKTCPSLTKPCEKLVAVTPMNKDKKVRFAEPVTSSSNIPKQTDSLKTKDSNKPLLTSTGVKPTTSASGSKPSGNTKNNRITHTSRTFTIVRNRCPLTRITSTKVVPTKETSTKSVATPTQGILVYSRRPKATRSVGSSSKVKIVESKTSNSKEPKQSWGSTVFDVPSSSLNDCRLSKLFCGTVRFGNDHIAKIMGYGDYQMGNVTISRVYYVEGLGHNLFSVGQFCDSDLEVAFRKHTCFIRDLDGVDLLKGSRGSNLYTLSMDNLLLSSPICLLSKASKTKSWLWHRRLSHLNFDYITSLAKHGLVRGLPKLKYQKDHLCSACALGKSKKHSHKPKAEDSIQEKLYLLHMDLCGPMRIQSINGRKYILVIVDDYSRFTWVKFLRSKDEVPEFVIKFLKMIQVRLNATVRNIRTDNGTEFVNQTLKAYYEEVRISHQTSVARTPQQNGVVERRNRTLVEAARTMLIFSKALLFLWAEAVATACYTQNRSLIRKRHNKTPYELLHDRKPDLSYLHVFGALCYPTNDGEDLGKLKPKADIGIFVGYAPAKKEF
ncbi:retrovirus-related pol polyprotein from transposon TNT 1-94 [Tanacetum coccineum]